MYQVEEVLRSWPRRRWLQQVEEVEVVLMESVKEGEFVVEMDLVADLEVVLMESAKEGEPTVEVEVKVVRGRTCS